MQLPFTFLTTGEVFHVEQNLHLLLEGWRVVFTLQKDINWPKTGQITIKLICGITIYFL